MNCFNVMLLEMHVVLSVTTRCRQDCVLILFHWEGVQFVSHSCHVNAIYQVLKVNWWMSFEIRFSLSTKLPFCFSLCICHQNMHSPCTVILFSSLYPFHRVHFYYIVQGQTWQWQTNANANSHHATFYFYFFTVFHLYFQTHSFHHR